MGFTTFRRVRTYRRNGGIDFLVRTYTAYANVKNAGLFCVKDYCNHGHTGSYTLVTPQGKLYFAQLREMILLVL